VSNRADATPSTSHIQLESFKDNELQELKRMYDGGQVSDVEYWQKLGQITERAAGQPTAAHVATSATTMNETYKMENKLSELKKLRDEGLITEADYEQKKTQILSQL